MPNTNIGRWGADTLKIVYAVEDGDYKGTLDYGKRKVNERFFIVADDFDRLNVSEYEIIFIDKEVATTGEENENE